MPATLLDTEAFYTARDPSLRRLTDDEKALFSAAMDAGAVLNPRELREYLEGALVFPLHWQTWVSLEDLDNPAICEAADRAKAAKAGFIARCRAGDLRAVAQRIDAARAPAKAA